MHVQAGSQNFDSAREAMASPLAKRLFGLDGVSGVFYGADYVTVTKKDDFTWPMLKPDIFAAIMDHFSSGGGPPLHWGAAPAHPHSRPRAVARVLALRQPPSRASTCIHGSLLQAGRAAQQTPALASSPQACTHAEDCAARAGQPLFTDASSQEASDTLILDTDSDVVAMIKELLETRIRPAVQEDGGDITYKARRALLRSGGRVSGVSTVPVEMQGALPAAAVPPAAGAASVPASGPAKLLGHAGPQWSVWDGCL